jgi:hypothetical protein
VVTSRVARAWFGATALVVLAGLVVQAWVTRNPTEHAFFPTTWKRELNILCFFTILSNIAVLISSFVLAAGLARPRTWFRAIRMIGLVGIALTFIVFQTVLRKLQDLTGQAAFADFMLHTASPILCVVGWLWFGPRRQTSQAAVLWALAYLIVWGGFTLIRGHAIGFYPYGFMDPSEQGYARVTVNLVIIAAIFVGMAAGAHLLDRTLRDRSGQISAA